VRSNGTRGARTGLVRAGSGFLRPHDSPRNATVIHLELLFAVGSKGKAIPVVRSAVIVRTGARFFCSIM
jgi:hypothetical protein